MAARQDAGPRDLGGSCCFQFLGVGQQQMPTLMQPQARPDRSWRGRKSSAALWSGCALLSGRHSTPAILVFCYDRLMGCSISEIMIFGIKTIIETLKGNIPLTDIEKILIKLKNLQIITSCHTLESIAGGRLDDAFSGEKTCVLCERFIDGDSGERPKRRLARC
ncbi:MAG: hypothetical protein ACX939_12235 [Hyphococcus sp.]